MHTSFVDRILARVDGELAPIWISQFLVLGAAPDRDRLEGALAALVSETARLRQRWLEPSGRWVEPSRPARDPRAVLRLGGLETFHGFIHRQIREPIDLATDVPLRVTLAPLEGGLWALAIQLHHAAGDGRALMHLTRRFWELYSGSEGEGALGAPRASDARVLREALRHAPALLALAAPRTRLLARRGHALRRRGGEPGAPMLASVRASVDERSGSEVCSGLFFGSLLAAMAAHDGGPRENAPIRLRIPVDLRRELGIGATVENACSAVPIEIGSHELTRALDDPAAMARLVPDALRGALSRGVHHATALECIVASRIASAEGLRLHVRPDLVAPRRANTMVATYAGTVDRHFEECSLPIETLVTHTPTWGANGYRFQNALIVNFTAFEGVWTREDLDGFAAAAAEWLSRHEGVSTEVLP